MPTPHNVDICVTCVSEKPPRLPLREELQSLGIEVVYNAHGVGAKASKQEQKQKLKEFQDRKLNFFSKLIKNENVEKRKEAELREPHAISYASYQKRLIHQKEPDGYKTGAKRIEQRSEGESEGFSSGSETRSSIASSFGGSEVAYDRYATHVAPSKHSKPPFKRLVIPNESPEDLAVKAAFDVFSGTASVAPVDRYHVPSPHGEISESTQSSSRYSTSSATEFNSRQASGAPSTISSQTLMNQRKYMHDEAEIAPIQGRPPSLFSFGRSVESRREPDDSSEAFSVESLQALAADYLSRPFRSAMADSSREESRQIDDSTAATKSVPSIKVSRVNRNNKVAELYDLTALSSEDETRDGTAAESITPVNRHFAQARDPAPQETCGNLSPRSQVRFENRLKFRVPEYAEEGDGFGDQFGRIVLDLSNVEEQDGPGSPLVLSPRSSPVRQRYMEGRQDSPPRFTGRDHFTGIASGMGQRLVHLRNSEQAIFDDTTTDPDPSGRSRLTFASTGKADSEQHVRQLDSSVVQSHSLGSNADGKAHPNAPAPFSFTDHYLRPASPKKSGYQLDDRKAETRYQEYQERHQQEPFSAQLLSASLKQSFSGDDSAIRPNLSVSFSQDVDARYYDVANEGGPAYDDIIRLVDEVDGGILSLTRAGPPMKRPREEILDPRPMKDQLIRGLMGESHIPRNAPHFIAKNKGFVREKLPGTKLYPLQAACMLEFPNRFVGATTCLVKDLVQDISERKQLILAFLQADASCCTYLDSENDLPVHLIARKLMEWEAKWYQKVYERAREDGSEQPGGGVGITTLYQTMSQTVDILLKPLAAKEELCRQPGTSGFLLPLHIAAIFTVNYNTLKGIIERYPAAAQHKCDLTGIRTFIPNLSTPLELHCRLSTDFPKWEINHYSDDEMEIQWTQSALDRAYGTVGGLRRSDLMFAFHSDVTPYRHETQRIRRFETRIRTEIESVVLAQKDMDGGLSLPVKLVWEWMCTYNGESADDHYADSVQRIVAPLSIQAIKLLAAAPTKYGRSIMDSALEVCATAIEDRLGEIKRTMVPVPMDTLAAVSRQRCFFLREWEERTAKEFCLHGRGFVGVLCRTIFNIRDDTYPTSFVLLPYQLVKDSEGRLGLESAEAAAIAMRFADTLLQLTDPLKVLHFLEKKALRFQGASLGIESSPEWDRVEAKTRKEVSQLLSLYASGKAYLYFIDEYTGVPIVPDQSENSSYPLVISDAIDTVRRVLPLMLSGMILMRGEKALSVIGDVLLNQNISMVQEHWISAAKDLLGYLYSPQTEWTPCFQNDLRPLRAPLVDLVETGVSPYAPVHSAEGLASEWVMELSLVKMLVEMYDANHSMCGLQPRRAGHLVLWTRETSFLESSNDLFLMDFKSLAQLKEHSEELEEGGLRKKNFRGDTDSMDEEHDKDLPSSSSSLYDMLYNELSYSTPGLSQKVPHDQPQAIKCFVAELPPIVHKRRRPMIPTPTSLIKFDDEDDVNLDDVLRLRILLDEQEAKLEFLRDRVSDLQMAEMHLLDEEDRMADMMDGLHRHTVRLEEGPSPALSRARKLLLRICDLEDRVQFGQVEMGQLQNDVACFALDARSP